ncbi:uncharacterized protein BXZ73DRAFT_80869 [Epithele typhae]|uniref:uncharacterized protein n=1 Tax=Epithele typhae TaxID=378194 RepID=UPI002008361A|nr:uncharacterized protein BXZ73DRAFT_80869 [Epithele typhae]KAH9917105.1 hypothetical protein BXZ73DRAFT_80869 [Epithele typhae]
MAQPQDRSSTRGQPTTNVAHGSPPSARAREASWPSAGRLPDSFGRGQTTTLGGDPLACGEEAHGRRGSAPALSTSSGPTTGQKPSIVRSSRLIIPPLPQPAPPPPCLPPPPPLPTAVCPSPTAAHLPSAAVNLSFPAVCPPAAAFWSPTTTTTTTTTMHYLSCAPANPPPHTRPSLPLDERVHTPFLPLPSASRPLPIPPAPSASVPASHGVPVGRVPDTPPNTRPGSKASYASSCTGATDSSSDGGPGPARPPKPAAVRFVSVPTSLGPASQPAPANFTLSIAAVVKPRPSFHRPLVPPPPTVSVTHAPAAAAPAAVAAAPPAPIAGLLASFPLRWDVRECLTPAFLHDGRLRQPAFAAGLTECRAVFNADIPHERFVATCRASRNGNPLTIGDVLRGIDEKLASTPNVSTEEPAGARAAYRHRARGADGPITYVDFVMANEFFFLGLRETNVPGSLPLC